VAVADVRLVDALALRVDELALEGGEGRELLPTFVVLVPLMNAQTVFGAKPLAEAWIETQPSEACAWKVPFRYTAPSKLGAFGSSPAAEILTDPKKTGICVLPWNTCPLTEPIPVRLIPVWPTEAGPMPPSIPPPVYRLRVIGMIGW